MTTAKLPPYKPYVYPNVAPDKEHSCGCVTFWCQFSLNHGTVSYRSACNMHRWYAKQFGLIVDPPALKTPVGKRNRTKPNASSDAT